MGRPLKAIERHRAASIQDTGEICHHGKYGHCQPRKTSEITKAKDSGKLEAAVKREVGDDRS